MEAHVHQVTHFTQRERNEADRARKTHWQLKVHASFQSQYALSGL